MNSAAGVLFLLFGNAAFLHSAQVVFQKNVPGGLGALDPAGNVYLAGSAITKLDSNGNQIYSKPLKLAGQPNGIAADSEGNVIIAGVIYTDDLATSPQVVQPKRNTSGTCIAPVRGGGPTPCSDAFVAKFDPSGNLAWASYLGGGQNDAAMGVAVDTSGNIYLTGWTLSSDFPARNGFQDAWGSSYDAFVTEISSDGTRIIHSSYIGGAGEDRGTAISLDSAGNVYVAGQTASGQFPVTAGSFGPSCPDVQLNAFLLKVASTGDRLTYSGCLAGIYTGATALAIDSKGAAYVGGYTLDPKFPATPGAFQSVSKPAWIDFITKISADGATLVYSSVFNGEYSGIQNIAVDSSGSVYAHGSIQTPTNFPGPYITAPPIPFTGTALEPCIDPYSGLFTFFLKLSADGSAPLYFSQDTFSFVGLAPDGSLYEETLNATLLKIAHLEAPSSGPFLASACVQNGASFASYGSYNAPGISPGEVVTLKGAGLGPQSPAGPSVAQSILGTSIGGVQVFFDGVPAPLIYVQDRQINAVAPYGLMGKTQTSIRVEYQGVSTSPVTMPVSPTNLTVFTDPATGIPLVFNHDFSVNSRSSPAAPGSAVVMFITGGGQTIPPSADGQILKAAGGLATPVSVEIQAAGPSILIPVLYAGPAPGAVSAVQQLNIQIPSPLPDTVRQTLGFFAGSALVNVTSGAKTTVVPIAVNPNP